MRWAWNAIIWVVLAIWMFWWLDHNPLPDGFQNEFIHVGSAYDLWRALLAWDVLHVRYYMYTPYWPWGLYAVPWPIMALFGQSHTALVSGNLIHLVVLLVAMTAMGKRLQAPLAPWLAVLCPGLFGSLVRFEPNVADIAWTAAGVACLLQSRRLRDLGPSLGWGICLGVGLMMDRLSVLFFLAPAILPLLWKADRTAWRNAILGGGAALLLSAAYYREFYLQGHTQELLRQAPLGEIDSAGAVSLGGGWLYYPMVLIDSQAGPIVGGIMLLGMLSTLRKCWNKIEDPGWVLLAAVLPGTIFFTFIAKQQVYYTLPILGPMAAMAAGRNRLAWLGLLGGLWSFAALGLGAVPGGPWMPEAWVAPRHTLARPPSYQQWPLHDGLSALELQPDDQLLIFSEDPTLYEGFVVLKAREYWPDCTVRGVTIDPEGSHEFLSEMDALVWVGDRSQPWPTAQQVRAELLADHHDIRSKPPIDEALSNASERFQEVGRWPAGDRDLVVFKAR